jgi:tetratricopeptide (TPR) repeat protein
MWIRRAAVAIIPCCVLLLAAAAPSEMSAEDLIRRANAAVESNDLAEAERLYQAAEVLTADPGLVAFNRATVLFQRAQAAQPELYAEAAKHYYWVLNDAACPPERAARAWFNRGTCLLRQPGATTAVYRSAIACLERCLDSDAADAPLRANAAYNLKLAKLLWNEARKKEKKDDSPNRDFPPEDPRSEQQPESPTGFDPQTGNPEMGEGNTGAEMPKVVPQPATAAGMRATPAHGQTPAPGPTGQIQPLEDIRDIRSLTPEETRIKLRQTAERLRRDQQIMRMTLYGGERTGLHDW